VTRLWLPSAESKLREGVRALRAYVAGLHSEPPTSKPLLGRNMELIRLFQSWGDLLGDAHGSLFKRRSRTARRWRSRRPTTTSTTRRESSMRSTTWPAAIEREYANDFASRPAITQLLHEVADGLGRAADFKPLVVLDGGPASLFANHRKNLDASIVDARQKIYSIREELEK
jgi:hypothetical protein